MGKILLLGVCVVVALILALIFFNQNQINSSAMSEVACDSYLYEQDFEDDNLIVVLDEKISKVNKIHKADFFKGIEIDYIKDLTKREISKESDNPNFRQILQIFLKNGSKDRVLQSISIIKNIDGVFNAEPNYLRQTAMIPNDPDFVENKLWGLNGINGISASSAWDITTGSKSVRVGIIDSGIANHPDLDDNLVPGWDFFNNNSTTTDDTHSHGTHVAGIIGAVGNNGLGVVGVNWKVSLVPLQVAKPNNLVSSSAVLLAIQWAIERWGTSEQIDIINYSISGFGSSTAEREILKDYKGLFVWAAGNDDTNLDEMIKFFGTFNLPNLISVGALKSDNTRPSAADWGYDDNGNPHGSNYSSDGTNVHIYAPGDRILSTVLNNGYGSKFGTSMAAPFVTGVAALLLSVAPELTATQLKQAILDGSDSIDILTPEGTKQTVKRLNAHKVLKVLSKDTSGYYIEKIYQNYSMENNISVSTRCLRLDGSYDILSGTGIIGGFNGISVSLCDMFSDSVDYSDWTFYESELVIYVQGVVYGGCYIYDTYGNYIDVCTYSTSDNALHVPLANLLQMKESSFVLMPEVTDSGSVGYTVSFTAENVYLNLCARKYI